jgi:hypothetical protein
VGCSSLFFLLHSISSLVFSSFSFFLRRIVSVYTQNYCHQTREVSNRIDRAIAGKQWLK